MPLLSAQMGLGVHVHMFFFAMQIKTWYDLLIGEVDKVLRLEEVLESKEPAIQKTIVFGVKSKASHYVQGPRINSSHP